MKSAFLLAAAMFSATPTYAQQQSIVGSWAENRAACASPLAGAIQIGPKSITSDEMSCRFDSVSRAGATVAWTGVCDNGNGNRRVRVTATETAGRLHVRFSPGRAWAPLIRCN